MTDMKVPAQRTHYCRTGTDRRARCPWFLVDSASTSALGCRRRWRSSRPATSRTAFAAGRPRSRRPRCRPFGQPVRRLPRSAGSPRRGTAPDARTTPVPTPIAAATDGSSAADAAAYPVAEGWKLSRPHIDGLVRNTSPSSEPRDTDAAACLDHCDGLSGGQPVAPGPGDLPQRRHDRPDHAEVGAGAHHHLTVRGAQPADRGRQQPDRGRRRHLRLHVVRADQDHRDMRAGLQRGVDLRGEIGRLRPGLRHVDQPDRSLGQLGEPGGEQHAGGLVRRRRCRIRRHWSHRAWRT